MRHAGGGMEAGLHCYAAVAPVGRRKILPCIGSFWMSAQQSAMTSGEA